MGFRRLLLAALVTGAAMPAAGQAATLAVDRPCYPVGGTITLAGGGFAPGSTVRFNYSNAGAAQVTATADGAGNFRQGIPAPRVTRSEQVITVSGSDGTNSAATPARITKPGFVTRPAQAAPGRRVLYRVRGFVGVRRIYVHYIYRSRRRATKTLTRPRGVCGVFSRRMRMLPVRRVRFGNWRVQVDASRVYSPLTAPRLSGTLRIFRRAS